MHSTDYIEGFAAGNRLNSTEGVMMDDLDHSIHIAQYEWESFLEECEGCCLLQPSLAGMDNLSLSDAEDCGSSTNPVSGMGCQDLQKSTVANTDRCQTNTEGIITVEDHCIGFTMLSIQGDMSNNKKEQPYYLTTEDEEVQENTIKSIKAKNYTRRTSKNEYEPLLCLESFMDTNMNVIDNTEEMLHERHASYTSLRTDKERWFVTMNYNSSQKRAHDTTTAKQKRREKKQEKKLYNNGLGSHHSDLEKNKDLLKESKDTEYLTHLHHNSAKVLQMSIQRESAQMHTIFPQHSEGGHVIQKLEISPIHKAYLTHVDPNEDRSFSEKPGYPLKFTFSDMFTPKEDNKSLDNTESDNFEDDVDMISTNSCFSESYSSTNESREECICLFKLTEEQPVETKELLQSTSTPTLQKQDVLNEPAIAENLQGTQMYKMQNVDFRSLSSNKADNPQLSLEECIPHVLSQQDESCDQAYAAAPGTFSPAGPSNIMTEDNSILDINMHRSLSDMPLESPETLKRKSTGMRISLSSDLLCNPPRAPAGGVPELTVTPLADSPEEYVQSLGHGRPVYAISAFWDEMEKLTINDILQLRMDRSSSPNIQEIGRPHGDVRTEMDGNAESLIPVGASVETSDITYSDYFTHLDDPKPDCSNFSDFDEEYYQFTGTRRNPSPECHDMNQQSQRTVANSTMCDLQVEHTKPDKAVLTEQCIEGHTLSSEMIYARGITRSKSMQNVQAFDSHVQVNYSQFKPAENRHQYLQSQEENTFWIASDNVMLTPSAILSNTDILDENYRITFPEVFEYFFSKNLENHGCVTVYDYDGRPIAIEYDYTLSQYGSEKPRSTLQDSQCEEEKLIPIFSYKHSNVEDLTFPDLDYLLFPPEHYDKSEREVAHSPLTVVTQSYIKDKDSGPTSAASDYTLFNQKGWARWKSWLPMRKLHFPGICSSWCQTSGAWVFPVGTQSSPIQRSNQTIPMLTERKAVSFSAQIYREVAAQQRSLTCLWTPVSLSRQDCLFSTLNQSDMCLVCIAVATWVLRSSDPRAVDTWKAALLANVSALSAIQYLRHYVKKDKLDPEP